MVIWAGVVIYMSCSRSTYLNSEIWSMFQYCIWDIIFCLAQLHKILNYIQGRRETGDIISNTYHTHSLNAKD